MQKPSKEDKCKTVKSDRVGGGEINQERGWRVELNIEVKTLQRFRLFLRPKPLLTTLPALPDPFYLDRSRDGNLPHQSQQLPLPQILIPIIFRGPPCSFSRVHETSPTIYLQPNNIPQQQIQFLHPEDRTQFETLSVKGFLWGFHENSIWRYLLKY